MVFAQADSGAALNLSPKSVQIKLEEGLGLIPFILPYLPGTDKQIEIWGNLAQSLTSEHDWSVHQQAPASLSNSCLFDHFAFATQVAGRVCQQFPRGFWCAPCPISLTHCTICLTLKVLPTSLSVSSSGSLSISSETVESHTDL